MEKIDFKEFAQRLKEAWAPIQVAQVNDTAIRVARVEGEYRWHTHPKEDEFFLVLNGEVIIETRIGDIELQEGEGVVVPKGVPHRSKAGEASVVLIVEPLRTNTYGVPLKEEGEN
jgi:mannose-6-phosphate isomerase-like protein (cupin superfamily)